MHPAESCSWRSWGALASTNIANQPLTTEVMTLLPRAFLQVEAPLCSAVGPEKSAVACAEESSLRQGERRALRPCSGAGCFLQELIMLQAPILL